MLCGWIFDIPRLTRLMPGLAYMKVNTACALVVASIALWLLYTHKRGSPWFRVARGLAVLLVALGSLTLFEHVFGLDLGIDQHIPSGAQLSAQSGHFGRVSPATPFILVFLGLALMTLRARRSNLAACAHWLIVPCSNFERSSTLIRGGNGRHRASACRRTSVMPSRLKAEQVGDEFLGHGQFVRN